MFLLEFLHSVRGWLRWAGWTLMVLLKIPSFIHTYLFPLPFASVQWDGGTGHNHLKVKCSRRIFMRLLSGTRSLREPLSFSFSSRSRGNCSGLWLPCLVYKVTYTQSSQPDGSFGNPPSAIQELEALKVAPWSAPPLCWLEPNLSETWKYDPGGDGLWFNVTQVQQATLLKETAINYLCLILLVDGGHGIVSSTRAQLVSNNCYIFSEIDCRCLNFNNLNNKLNQVERGAGRQALLMKAGQLSCLSAFLLWHERWHTEMKSG